MKINEKVETISIIRDIWIVTANISLSSSFTATNVNITFKVQGNDGLIKREESQLFNINSGDKFEAVTQSITLNDGDFVHVYADTTNKVSESNEKNNYALAPLFKKDIKVYFDVDTGYPKVNNKIKEYIKLFVFEETNQNLADVTLCVGRKCSNFNSLNDYTLKNWQKSQKFGNLGSRIVYNGKDVGRGKPYNAIVGGFWKDTDGKNYVMAYGDDIDGDIAAVKKLISARELFFNKDLLMEERTKVIDDYDLTGISVADLLRNENNFPYYTQRNSDVFANIAKKLIT